MLPLMPSLSGPLWPGVVAPDRVLSVGQIGLNCILMQNWIVLNFERELIICIKMDLVLNNLKGLICHKTQPTNQPIKIHFFLNRPITFQCPLYMRIWASVHVFMSVYVCARFLCVCARMYVFTPQTPSLARCDIRFQIFILLDWLQYQGERALSTIYLTLGRGWTNGLMTFSRIIEWKKKANNLVRDLNSVYYHLKYLSQRAILRSPRIVWIWSSLSHSSSLDLFLLRGNSPLCCG